MPGIAPISLESMIAMSKNVQPVTPERGEQDQAAIGKAFLSLLMESMDLISMSSVSGGNSSGNISANDSHLLVNQIFKDWLIGQELGFQSADKAGE